MLAATPALASASSPSFYVLKHAKAHCRSGYSKKTVTITVKRHHHKVKQHQVRCVRKHASGGGSGVTFPAGLPTVTVTPGIVPTALGHTYVTTAGHTLSVAAPGVLAGASGHGLTAQLVSGTSSGALALGKDGSFTYAPAAGTSGIVHFTYKAADVNSTTSSVATVTIEVLPVAQGAVYAVNSGQTLFIPASQLLSADVGTGLGLSLVGNTADGSLTLDASGATYIPNSSFSGADAFTYQAVDSSGLRSNTVTVQINVGSAPPSVVPQTFTGAVGNTPLVVGGARGSGAVVYQASGSLLAGDSDPNGGALSVVPGTQSTAHGSVTIAADGSFVYTPAPGVDSGSDSFSYQVDTSEGTSATTSATIDFSGARVWYVDDSFSGTSDGSAGAPFTTLAAAHSAASSGDQIFVFTGSSAYNGGIVLPAGVSLAGEGADLTAGGSTLLAHATAPTITNTSGPGVTVGEGSRISGLNITANAGAGVTATAVNSFTVDSSVSIIASSAAHDALDISGGNGTVEVDAQITATGAAGHSVAISGRTGGTVTLAGAISDNGDGHLDQQPVRRERRLHGRDHREHRGPHGVQRDRRQRRRHRLGEHACDHDGDGARRRDAGDDRRRRAELHLDLGERLRQRPARRDRAQRHRHERRGAGRHRRAQRRHGRPRLGRHDRQCDRRRHGRRRNGQRRAQRPGDLGQSAPTASARQTSRCST